MGERSPRTTLLLLNCQYSFYKKAFLYVNIRNCYCTNRDHAPPPPWTGFWQGHDSRTQNGCELYQRSKICDAWINIWDQKGCTVQLWVVYGRKKSRKLFSQTF